MNPLLRRSVISAQLLIAFANERGVPVARCLVGTDIEPARLHDPAAEITADQELTLVTNLVRELGDEPGLGLAAGARYHLTAYGLWGLALTCSPTLRQAVQRALRYQALTFGFTRFELEEADGEARLLLSVAHLPPAVRRFLLERDAAAVLQLQRELLALPVPPCRLLLETPAPAESAALRALLGVAPTFGAASSRIILPAGLLERRLPQGDPALARECDRQCQQLLARRGDGTSLAAEVRARLQAHPEGNPSMEAIAAELRTSGRTLRRRLLAEGVTFRGLLEEVRRAQAERLLGAERLSVEEVAGRLGYSEPANFIHAFRRWTGTTPGAYRRGRGGRTTAPGSARA